MQNCRSTKPCARHSAVVDLCAQFVPLKDEIMQAVEDVL
jgi:hypothetical protein